jgi:hypothetical protein
MKDVDSEVDIDQVFISIANIPYLPLLPLRVKLCLTDKECRHLPGWNFRLFPGFPRRELSYSPSRRTCILSVRSKRKAQGLK